MISAHEFAALDAVAMAAAVRAGDIAPVELLEAALQRLAHVDPAVHAVCERFDDAAHAAALAVDRSAPLAGVPFLVKDLVLQMQGVVCRAGSLTTARLPAAAHDSELMRRFRGAGLVTFGKTTTPEFGAHVTTESRLYGVTRNPWRLDRSSGGSSGGAAAAVAAGIVPMAHANDGLGSIRIPAAACGLFGLKPTRQRTPTGPDLGDLLGGRGVEFAVTRTVRDAAALLDAVHGPDAGAPSHAPAPRRPYADECRFEPRRLRVAVCARSFSGAAVHDDVRTATVAVARRLEALGHRVEAAAPALDWAGWQRAIVDVVASGVAIAMAEEGATAAPGGARSTEAALDAHVRMLAVRGAEVSPLRLAQAQAAFVGVQRSLGRFFRDFDILLTPVLSAPVAAIGELLAASVDLDGYAAVMAGDAYSPFAGVFNVGGQPAASVPAGLDRHGVPIGVQVVASYGEDGEVIRVAAELERDAGGRWPAPTAVR